ncbi:MAG: NosD domain-containing protein [Thermoplasmata archaeon]
MIKMKRRILFILLIALVGLMLLSIFAVAQSAKARTINVDDNGGANYTKIQDAINAASPGDTVYVYNGIYNEQITINKAINLTGENSDGTIIKGDGSEYSIGIKITRNSTIRCFWIDRFGSCIAILGGSETTVSDNKITNGTDSGISVGYTKTGGFFGSNFVNTSTNSNTILRNTITNTIDSVHIYKSQYNVVSNNIFMNNTSRSDYERGHAVLLESCSYNEVSLNVVRNINCSVHLKSGSNNRIIGNSIENGHDGIHLEGCTYNLISENTIMNQQGLLRGYGIYLTNSDNNTVTSNNITNSHMNGIYLEYSSNNLVAYNNIKNCGREGICMYGCRYGNTIRDNTIKQDEQRVPGFEFAWLYVSTITVTILFSKRKRVK